MTGFPRVFPGVRTEQKVRGTRRTREVGDNTGIELEDVSRQEQDTSSSIRKGLARRRVTIHRASLEPRSCQGGKRERNLGRTTQLGTREL